MATVERRGRWGTKGWGWWLFSTARGRSEQCVRATGRVGTRAKRPSLSSHQLRTLAWHFLPVKSGGGGQKRKMNWMSRLITEIRPKTVQNAYMFTMHITSPPQGCDFFFFIFCHLMLSKLTHSRDSICTERERESERASEAERGSVCQAIVFTTASQMGERLRRNSDSLEGSKPLLLSSLPASTPASHPSASPSATKQASQCHFANCPRPRVRRGPSRAESCEVHDSQPVCSSWHTALPALEIES